MCKFSGVLHLVGRGRGRGRGRGSGISYVKPVFIGCDIIVGDNLGFRGALAGDMVWCARDGIKQNIAITRKEEHKPNPKKPSLETCE